MIYQVSNILLRFKTSMSRSDLCDYSDLDIIMLMYNLLEYSQNYSMTSGSLWKYLKEEIDDVNDNVSDGTSFKYKTKMVEKFQKDHHDLEI